MRPVTFHPDTLIRLLRRKKIVTMGEMKASLGTSVDMTIFRKLREIPYHSSYSHRGKYYAMDEVTRFDDRGLWSCRGVHFSRFGSLVDTAHEFVERSVQGCLVPELTEELQVSVQQPLLHLTRSGRLVREVVSGLYVYCSADSAKRRRQLLRRRETEGPSPLTTVSASEEARAAVILFFSLLDEKQRRLYAGIESIKLGRGGDHVIAEWTGLSRQTIARGRRELLERDWELDRVRKPGGGRPPVKKNA
jgi:hypothetical protein